MRLNRMLGAFALAIVCLVAARADAADIETSSTEIGESFVRYPVLQGLSDEDIQRRVNDDIVEKADIASHLLTLGTLSDNGLGLTVDEAHYETDDLLSVVIDAKGKMPNGREGQCYTALCYDLRTGEPITADQLFADADAAAEWMGERLEETYADELSGYADHSELTPIPLESFALDEYGITFYYPASQFSLLSGYSGACQFHYYELRDFWDRSEDGIARRLGLIEDTPTDTEAMQALRDCLSQGRLPNLPVTVGESVPELIARYRLLRQADEYPGGRYVPLEAPQFRQTLLMTDALSKGYDGSVVQGIHTMRADLYGIETGVTTQARWRELLGQPDSTVDLDEGTAYDYGLPAGQSDYYSMADYRLRLHADADGVLYSVTLSK